MQQGHVAGFPSLRRGFDSLHPLHPDKELAPLVSLGEERSEAAGIKTRSEARIRQNSEHSGTFVRMSPEEIPEARRCAQRIAPRDGHSPAAQVDRCDHGGIGRGRCLRISPGYRTKAKFGQFRA